MSSTSPPTPTDPELGAPPLDLTGRTLAGYHILRKLGQGGMGQVYLAEQISLKRKVALKVLRPEVAASASGLARFRAEAEAVARATHANIVQVYDHGQADGILFLALEYVEGRNLKEFLVKKGPPDLLVSLSIMRQVAAALHRAGELGITHRDIKPENILLTRKGEVKVADFGLSRCLEGETPALNLTQTGVTMGTPLYMSPEQVEGKPVDPRSDVYSFGVTCYHLLAGHPPFQGATAFEVALAHVRQDPVPLAQIRPDLPERLCAIVHKMMAKQPADRYQTCRDLLRDIARLRETLSGASTAFTDPPTVSVEPVPAAPAAPPRRGLLAAGMLLSVFAALAAGVAFGWRERVREGPLPGNADLAPSDAGTVETICLPNKREQTLREAVDQYLNVPRGKTPEANGFGVCADLALLYLNEHRLDDAELLFNRLDMIRTPRSYYLLGHVGQGIVLALRNKHRESNQRFRDVFAPFPNLIGRLKGKKAPPDGVPRKLNEYLAPINTILQHDDWRFWLGRARWYNHRNGLGDEEVPRFLLTRFPLGKMGGAPPSAKR